MLDRDIPEVQGVDTASAEAMLAHEQGTNAIDPRALGLLPFAPVRRRVEGSRFAYNVWEWDVDRIAGVACRMADATPIRWPLGRAREAV